MSEAKEKTARVRSYLKRHGLEAAVFITRGNFAWLSCGGDNHVAAQSETGAAALVVTARQRLLVTSTIESERLVKEEHLGDWTLKQHPWTTPFPVFLAKILNGKRAAADEPAVSGLPALPGDFAQEVRAALTAEDIKRYRRLGRDCALVIETVARQLDIGSSGFQVEADLARHLLARGIQPNVILVGFDERLRAYRHPIPTANHLRHHAMLVVGGKRHGLIASLTRCVHFGPLPEDVRRAHAAVCRVENALWGATVPGATWGAALQAGLDRYKREGYAKEWQQHHQGGPTGFAARDFRVTPDEQRRIQLHQAVAWNPTITGAKSEDTIVVGENGPEVITGCSRNWPTIGVEVEDKHRIRPDILIR